MTYQFEPAQTELTIEHFTQLVENLSSPRKGERFLWVSNEIKAKLRLGDYFGEFKIVTTPLEKF